MKSFARSFNFFWFAYERCSIASPPEVIYSTNSLPVFNALSAVLSIAVPCHSAFSRSLFSSTYCSTWALLHSGCSNLICLICLSSQFPASPLLEASLSSLCSSAVARAPTIVSFSLLISLRPLLCTHPWRPPPISPPRPVLRTPPKPLPSPIPFITFPTAVVPAAPNTDAPRNAYSFSLSFFLMDIWGILTLKISSRSFGASLANFKIPRITTTVAITLIKSPPPLAKIFISDTNDINNIAKFIMTILSKTWRYVLVNSLNHLSNWPPLGFVILKNIGIGAINFKAPSFAALTPKSSENDKNK